MTIRDMRVSNIDEIGGAFVEALDYCRLYGLNWRDHIIPKRDNGKIVGYYVLDETKSTTVATVEI